MEALQAGALVPFLEDFVVPLRFEDSELGRLPGCSAIVERAERL